MTGKHFVRLAGMGFAAFLLGSSPAWAQVSQGTAADFAVLGGSAVTCTNSDINGSVGVDLGGAITRTNCTISGTVNRGDLIAQRAYDDFLAAYAAMALVPCDFNLTGQPLSGQTLTPGVYCFDAAVTETGGVLTLNGSSSDTWIFKIGTKGTGALTGTNFTVVMSSGEACNNNVSWWTAEAATLTDSVFVGSVLAGTSVTVTRGSLDGQALAKAAVTLTSTSVCGGSVSQPPPPPPCTVKVTGGGQIAVPNPNSKGRATFGFNAKGSADGAATGHFNFVNHLTGSHVNGAVDHVAVITTNPDGSPKTVQFTGTCSSTPACSFRVTVQDNGEPGSGIDAFGITVTGARSETVSQRLISRGNIQLHKSCDGHGDNNGDEHHSCDEDHGREDGKKGEKNQRDR